MKGVAKRCIGLIVACLSLCALAAPEAQVETVQAPAWLLRAGKQIPLVAGTRLENRDRLLTGEGARVVVLFGDGSTFRLGENSRVMLNALAQERAGRFSGGLDVSEGDGHLVVHDFEEAPVRRAINVRFGQVTAMVRGEADVAGVADAETDRVALRDGAAVVSHPLGVATALDTQLQVYAAGRETAPAPVRTISRGEGAVWALQTQPLDAAGTQQPGGRWWLSFGVFDKGEVLALHDRLKQAGFATRIRPQLRAGAYVYELRLPDLVSEREAQALARRLAAELQIAEPRSSRG